MAYLAIDVGTTGCKAAVYAPTGEQLSFRCWEYDRPQGATRYDGEKIFDQLCGMIPEAVRESGAHVRAVGVSSQGEAFAPIGRDGRALYPFLQNADPCGLPYANRIPAHIAERIRRVNGLAPLPRYGLMKMMYLREREPEVFSRLWKYMLFEDYVVYRLTGNACTDYSIATRTNAFNLEDLRFDDQILQLAGIDASFLGLPLLTGSVAGTLLPSLSARLGLESTVQVVLAGHDCIPENLCSGVIREGIASLGCGTAEGVGMIVPQEKLRADRALAANLGREPYPVSGHQLVFGFNGNSGSLVKWYRDWFGKAMGREQYAQLDADLPAEPTGILTVPHFSGSSTPDFRADARGTITGLRFCHTPAHIYKSLLEGAAYEMRYILEQMRGAGLIAKEFRLSGGGAKSPQWMQIKADVLGVPVVPLRYSDTTVSGCAMIAAKADGAFASWEEAVDTFVSLDPPILPDAPRARQYDELYAAYRSARERSVEQWRG